MGRCRWVTVDAWAVCNDARFFASGKGRGPLDVVWKSAVLDESLIAKNKIEEDMEKKTGRGEKNAARQRNKNRLVTAIVLWDAVHFYDRFSHNKNW